MIVLLQVAQQINLQLAHNHTSEVDLCVEKRLNKDICHYSQSQNKNKISSNVKDVLNKQGKTNSINQKDVESSDIENCQSFIEQNYSTTEMSQSKSNQNFFGRDKLEFRHGRCWGTYRKVGLGICCSFVLGWCYRYVANLLCCNRCLDAMQG